MRERLTIYPSKLARAMFLAFGLAFLALQLAARLGGSEQAQASGALCLAS